MIIRQTHIVPDSVKDIRIKDYAVGIFSLLQSRKGVTKAIKRGEIRLDGEIVETGRFVKSGQKIDLLDLQLTPPKKYRLKLPVVYEDEYIAVINKPAGIEVNGNKFKTIENALSDNIALSKNIDALSWPRPVHRLDYPTSGLLLIAKTHKAQIGLGEQFENRSIKKRYRAIVMGKPSETGIIEHPIDGRDSKSEFKLIKSVPSLQSTHLSLVDLWPHTGRKHQLRKHMASLGFPILGDKQYGVKGNILHGKGLFLSAVELTFIHPITKEHMNIAIDEPKKFQTTLKREKSRWEKFKI